MTLPNGTAGNTQISMGQMRTEFRNDSNPILMSQLYRGAGLVPSTQSGTSTTTVGASINNLTGTPVSNSGTSGSYNFGQQARFTSNMTCGNNGNVTANGNIVFTSSAGGDGDNGENISIVGGIRVVSIDATTNAAGTVTSGTTYKSFTGVTTFQALHSATMTTTITSGTSLDVPNGVTSFKILTYATVNKRMTGQNEGYAGVGLNNPTSGAFTSTTTTSTTTNINQSVPPSGEFEFSDMYGAFDV